jgi:hypothetical protein
MTAAFGPQNSNALLALPVDSLKRQRYGSAQTWVKDASAPGANDGTILDAAFFNRIIANLENVLDVSGIEYNYGSINSLRRAFVAIVRGAAPENLSTITMLATAINNDPAFSTNVFNAIANRIRFDASQSLSNDQKLIAFNNLGLAAVAASGSFADLSNKNIATAAEIIASVAGKLVTADQSWLAGAEVVITPPINVSTLTLAFTNGSAVITSSADHGMVVGAPWHPTTSAAGLPTNFTAGMEMWVVSVPTTTTFTAAFTRGGTAVLAGSAGSGVHTLNKRLLLDFSTFINAVVTLSASITVASAVNPVVGRGGRIRWLQDGTGGRLRTYRTGGNYVAVGGAAAIAALSTAASAKDIDFYDALSPTELLIGASPLKAIAA